jgi:hypothetical protein
MKTQILPSLREPGALMHLLKALAWMTAGITVTVFLAGRSIHIFQLMRGGATASARVIETFEDEREDERRIGIVTVAVYEFFVQRSRFVGKTEGARGSFSVGDAIAITYNPSNPTQNRAKGDRHELGNYLVLLICGGLFSYYTITLNFPALRRLFTSEAHSTRKPIVQ